ncbi:unnamed protein product [Cylicocyclus nassatus]|uniref:CID domain-containing protein n=1 Tax=Cylicocyclus nassatus TaxID=53992 RepID=A0AA36LZT2_CYLNA|nr:unnamed protein product [Cylicocyclus nassatus]
MDTEVVKAFNAELTSVYESKPPLSKKKIQDISKAALKAKGYYKHVVFSVEKFLAKCKTEYKIPCLYVIDSIIRTSKHQFKERDVYASRFLKNFSKTLADLLSCPVADQPRVVRTLNLWGANGVYTEDQLAPFKQQCRDMGIDTDIERVERLVKGEDADMSRYGGAYGRVKEKEKKKHHRNSAPESPPHDSSDLGPSTTPPMPPPAHLTNAAAPVGQAPATVSSTNDNEPSDEIPPCGLSERKLLEMMLDANFDFSGAFKNDIVLLRKAHGLIARALDARIRSVGEKPEIKDLLSSQFDYSDEEDDGDENKKAKRPEKVKEVCQEDLLNIARNLIEDPNVIAAFKHMHAERIVALNQIAAQAQQRSLAAAASATANTPTTTASSGLPGSTTPNLSSAAAAAALQGINLPKGLPPGLTLPQGLPAGLPNLATLQGVQGLPSLQNLAGLPSLNLAHLSALNPGNAQQHNQALLNLLANNSLVSKLGNLPNLPFPNARTPVSIAGGIDPAQLAKQQEILQQLASAGGSAALSGVPPPSGLGLLGAAPGQLLGTLPAAPVPMMTDDNDSDKDARKKDRKRSRSRDRGDHKRRRSRSKERKTEKVDRERKKLGLPAIQEGLTTVASKTLWFGRLPVNCSDTDIRTAIASAGEITRVNLISSRACAYVTMSSRKAAYDVLQRLAGDLQIQRKVVKVDWAKGAGMKANELAKYWDSERGLSLIPWNELPSDMERFCEGSYLDVETLPPEKRSLLTDTGAKVTTPSSNAAPTKTDTSSPHSPQTTMHASPIKSLVPDSPAVLQPVHHAPPQAVPPPSSFPPFMGSSHTGHGGHSFMGPPPQMVPPPGFGMRLPMPPALPSGMPPGMPGQMFGMPPGGPGSMVMPPPVHPPGGMPPPSSMPPQPSMQPPASMPPAMPGVSGMPRPGPPVPPGGGGPPPGPPSNFGSQPMRGGFGGPGLGGFRGGRGGGFGGRGGGGFHGDRPFNREGPPNMPPARGMNDDRRDMDRDGRRPWNDRSDRGNFRDGPPRRPWNNDGRDGRGREFDRDRRRDDNRGDKRRSRWGDSDDRGPDRWEGRDRRRSERDERDRNLGDRNRERDRHRENDRDRERDRETDRRRDREREERNDRGRRERDDRDRHRSKERESPRYDEPVQSQSNPKNGSEEAMVTSTTDVESNTTQQNNPADSAEDQRKAIAKEDQMLDNALENPPPATA